MKVPWSWTIKPSSQRFLPQRVRTSSMCNVRHLRGKGHSGKAPMTPLPAVLKSNRLDIGPRARTAKRYKANSICPTPSPPPTPTDQRSDLPKCAHFCVWVGPSWAYTTVPRRSSTLDMENRWKMAVEQSRSSMEVSAPPSLSIRPPSGPRTTFFQVSKGPCQQPTARGP